MANLDQLGDSSKLKIRVSIEEYMFHSAMIHNFANNFQRLFREEIAKEESLKVCSPIAVSNALVGLFHLSDQVLFWLLSSDNIKVEDEHHILSFVFQHTKLKTLRKGLANGIQSANLLSRCIRFNLLDIYNIMSALRKNEALQLSEVFTDAINYEFAERLLLSKQQLIVPLADMNSNEEKAIYTGPPRKYVNAQMTSSHGREKI